MQTLKNIASQFGFQLAQTGFLPGQYNEERRASVDVINLQVLRIELIIFEELETAGGVHEINLYFVAVEQMEVTLRTSCSQKR